jgi:hypothetical protein
MTKRQADNDQEEIAYQRTATRTVCRDDKWYFFSREGEHGPFASEAHAEDALDAYVQLIDLRPEDEGPVVPDEV